MRFLGAFLLGFGGLAALFAGPFVLLPTVGLVSATYGPAWGAVAFAATLVLCAIVMLAFFRASDRATSLAGPGGRARPDHLVCQCCLALVSLGDAVCGRCGSTRFAVAPPMTP